MSDIKLAPGITPAGKSSTPAVWNILGHTYYEKSNCATSFSFETLDPPGTFVPPHIHPTQDEFIYMLEGHVRPVSRRPMGEGIGRRSRAHADGPAAWLLQQDRQADPRPVLGFAIAQAEGIVRAIAQS